MTAAPAFRRRGSVFGGPELTRRVLTNLVDNAVAHGGRETIAIRWEVERDAAAARCSCRE